MAVDTFGQMSPLVAFRESRPPSSAAAAAAGPPDSSAGRQQNNGNGGLKSGTPPQMYTTDATMAIEEYTGTTSNNSSPTKMPTTGRSNASSTGIPMSSKHNGNNQYTSSANATNAMIRRKGLPWVLAAQIFVIFLLLAIIGFLLYKMYGEEPGKVGTSDLQQPTPVPISPAHSFISSASPTQPLAAPKEQIKPTESESNNNKDQQKPPSDWPPALDTRTLQARFAKAAVVSENGICSEIGRNVLWRGGNAVDAAIAVAICIGGLNGHSAGLGGGFLMTYYRRFYGKCISIDARETAPSRTNRDTFSSIPEEIINGYKSVAVPGELHGLWTAFKRFGSGKIAWMDLLLPTVSLLNEGYPASRHMEEVLKEFAGTILNGTAPGMRAQFVNPGTGLLYREGEIIRNPVLAETLRRLATSHDPVQLFYSQSGEMARTIADEFAQNGGFLNRKDLHSYRSVVDEQPLLNTQAHPRLVFCGPKPSSGFAVAQLILAIMLKFYPPGSAPTTPWTSVEYWHRLVEAQKYAFALRTKLGDGHFLKEAIQLALNMTESAFVDQIAAKIGPKASNYADFGFMHTGDIEAFIDEDGTSQLAVVDADGNALSMTHSLNNAFGSVVRSPQLGIVWNNHMDDFSVPGLANGTFGFAPSRANFIEPGKRPMSSMSPLVVYDRESRKVKMAIGASGGPKIPSAVAQVLSQVLSFNHSLKLAIDTPRLHNQFTPFDTHYEAGFPQQFVHELAERFGHGQLQGMDFPIANVHGILRAEGKEEEFLVASNDHRRKILSYPVGY